MVAAGRAAWFELFGGASKIFSSRRSRPGHQPQQPACLLPQGPQLAAHQCQLAQHQCMGTITHLGKALHLLHQTHLGGQRRAAYPKVA